MITGFSGKNATLGAKTVSRALKNRDRSVKESPRTRSDGESCGKVAENL
jgi:hypothetical protein